MSKGTLLPGTPVHDLSRVSLGRTENTKQVLSLRADPRNSIAGTSDRRRTKLPTNCEAIVPNSTPEPKQAGENPHKSVRMATPMAIALLVSADPVTAQPLIVGQGEVEIGD